MKTSLEAARKRLREAEVLAKDANAAVALARQDVMRLALHDDVWKWLLSLQVGDKVCLSVETHNWWTVVSVTDFPSLEVSRPSSGKWVRLSDPSKIQRAYYATWSTSYAQSR